ncbi:MAG: hypothetical protein ACYS26_16170 [Planctomycetota bacterium]|jgi:hypothetical protein
MQNPSDPRGGAHLLAGMTLILWAGACTASEEQAPVDPNAGVVEAEEGELGDEPADDDSTGQADESTEGGASEQPAEPEEPVDWAVLGAGILEQVSEYRGLDVLGEVPIETADAEAARTYTMERLFSLSSEAELQAQARVAKLLGLLAPQVDLLELVVTFVQDQAGGFYDPVRGQIFVLPGFSGALARAVLAHELTHALDDQRYNLQASMESRSEDADALAAFHAVMEGSAMVVQEQWSREQLSMDELLEVARESADQSAELFEAPAFLWRPLLCSYLQGTAFLKRAPDAQRAATRSADPVDVARAFADPPRSTEQILHPEKYWDDELVDVPTRVRVEPVAESGWDFVHADGLGELGLAELFLDGGAPPVGAMLTIRFVHPATEGWDGDRFALFEREGAEYLTGWIVFDSEAEAEEFEAAFEAGPRETIERAARRLGDETGGVRLIRDGANVTLEVYSAASALPEQLADVATFSAS